VLGSGCFCKGRHRVAVWFKQVGERWLSSALPYCPISFEQVRVAMTTLLVLLFSR